MPTIVLHKVYNFACQHMGRDIAGMWVKSILEEFRIIELNTSIAISSARLKCKHRGLPTADATTSMELKSTRIISDDYILSRSRKLRLNDMIRIQTLSNNRHSEECDQLDSFTNQKISGSLCPISG